MPGFGRLSLIIVAVILGACTQPPVGPEPLNFDSDPRILRGAWTGRDENGNSLLLYLKAGSPSESGYEVEGLFQLSGGLDVAVAGRVLASVARPKQALAAQVSPVCPGAVLVISSDRAQDGDWELCGDAPTGTPPTFNLAVIDQSVPGGVYTFLVTKQENELADPNLLVSGSIVYALGKPYTYPEPFEFTENSHAVVRLYYSWSALGDAPSELVAETTLGDLSSFPLEYRLGGDAEAVFARRGDYFLQVDVYSGAGDTAKVGDLTSEMYTPVPDPGAEVEVEVTGLEPCNSPDVGGVCAGDTPD